MAITGFNGSQFGKNCKERQKVANCNTLPDKDNVLINTNVLVIDANGIAYNVLIVINDNITKDITRLVNGDLNPGMENVFGLTYDDFISHIVGEINNDSILKAAYKICSDKTWQYQSIVNVYQNTLIEKIKQIIVPDCLFEICLCFDGIPSWNKYWKTFYKSCRRIIQLKLTKNLRKKFSTPTESSIPYIDGSIFVPGSDFFAFMMEKMDFWMQYPSVLGNRMMQCQLNKFSISPNTVFGEGEHKIISHIKHLPKNINVCVQSDDSDMVLLLALLSEWNIVLINRNGDIYDNNNIRNYMYTSIAPRYLAEDKELVIRNILFALTFHGNDYIEKVFKVHKSIDIILAILKEIYYKHGRGLLDVKKNTRYLDNIYINRDMLIVYLEMLCHHEEMYFQIAHRIQLVGIYRIDVLNEMFPIDPNDSRDEDRKKIIRELNNFNCWYRDFTGAISGVSSNCVLDVQKYKLLCNAIRSDLVLDDLVDNPTLNDLKNAWTTAALAIRNYRNEKPYYPRCITFKKPINYVPWTTRNILRDDPYAAHMEMFEKQLGEYSTVFGVHDYPESPEEYYKIINVDDREKYTLEYLRSLAIVTNSLFNKDNTAPDTLMCSRSAPVISDILTFLKKYPDSLVQALTTEEYDKADLITPAIWSLALEKYQVYKLPEDVCNKLINSAAWKKVHNFDYSRTISKLYTALTTKPYKNPEICYRLISEYADGYNIIYQHPSRTDIINLFDEILKL
jgi:hypothetical protein